MGKPARQCRDNISINSSETAGVTSLEGIDSSGFYKTQPRLLHRTTGQPGASIHPDDRLRLSEEPTGHSEVAVGLDANVPSREMPGSLRWLVNRVSQRKRIPLQLEPA